MPNDTDAKIAAIAKEWELRDAVNKKHMQFHVRPSVKTAADLASALHEWMEWSGLDDAGTPLDTSKGTR